MRTSGALLVGVLAVVAAGCGDPAVKVVAVKGKVVQGGEPYKVTLPGGHPLPPGDPGVRVKFVRTGDQTGQAFTATFKLDDATFTVPGPTGNGIPPGTYDVIVYSGAAGDRDAKGGPPGGARTGPPGGKGGPPGANMPSMDGKEVARKEVTVPDGGLTDLVIEVPAGKK